MPVTTEDLLGELAKPETWAEPSAPPVPTADLLSELAKPETWAAPQAPPEQDFTRGRRSQDYHQALLEREQSGTLSPLDRKMLDDLRAEGSLGATLKHPAPAMPPALAAATTTTPSFEDMVLDTLQRMKAAPAPQPSPQPGFAEAMKAVQAPPLPKVAAVEPAAQPPSLEEQVSGLLTGPAAYVGKPLVEGAKYTGSLVAEGAGQFMNGLARFFSIQNVPEGEFPLKHKVQAARDVVMGLMNVGMAPFLGYGRLAGEALQEAMPERASSPFLDSAQSMLVRDAMGGHPAKEEQTPEVMAEYQRPMTYREALELAVGLGLPGLLHRAGPAVAPHPVLGRVEEALKGTVTVQAEAEAPAVVRMEARPPGESGVAPGVRLEGESGRLPAQVQPLGESGMVQPTPAVVVPKAKSPVLEGLSFTDYAKTQGRWPISVSDPGYRALRTAYDAIGQPRYGLLGTEVVEIDQTGQPMNRVSQHASGAQAQLEANRLNAQELRHRIDAVRGVAAAPAAPVEPVQPVPPAPAVQVPTPPEPVPAQASLLAQVPEEQALERAIQAVEQARAKAEQVVSPTPIAAGKEGEVRVPAGPKYRARYEVVDAASLVTSHDPFSFARRPEYPEGVQNRPYHTDKGEQAKVIRQEQDFDPAFLVSPQPSSEGTPIVAPDSNVVLSGNSRTMTLLRVLKERPQDFERYRAALAEVAPSLGIDPAQLAQAQAPVLVRRLVKTPTSLDFYRRFARETNETFTQALNVEAEAVSRGGAISPETLDYVAGRLDQMGPDASLRDIFSAGQDRELVRRLIRDGVVSDREIGRYVDTQTGTLNDGGRRLVERALLGSIVKDSDLLQIAPDMAIDKIGRAIAPMAKLRAMGAPWDLSGQLTEALRTVTEVRQRNFSSVEALRQQTSLLPTAPVDPASDVLATGLLRMKPTEFRRAAETFAAEGSRQPAGQAQLGFIQPKSPEQAFTEAFGIQRPPSVAEEPIQWEATPIGEQALIPGTPPRVEPRPAPATFVGWQERPGGHPPLALYNLTEDIPGHPVHSTVSAETLMDAGFTPPEPTRPAPAAAPLFGGQPAAVEPVLARLSQALTGAPVTPPLGRSAATMGEAIALSSPSGRMSGAARRRAQERLREALFGPEGLQRPAPAQPTEAVALRRQAAQLRELADRGMKPRAYRAEADQLERRADALEAPPTAGEAAQPFAPQAEPAPTFYSRLQRAIEAKMPARASADQVTGILNSAGVSLDERRWTGIDDWLSDRKGQMVTKQEVGQFLRDNAITVEERVHGEPSAEDIAALDDLQRRRDEMVDKRREFEERLQRDLVKAGLSGQRAQELTADLLLSAAPLDAIRRIRAVYYGHPEAAIHGAEIGHYEPHIATEFRYANTVNQLIDSAKLAAHLSREVANERKRRTGTAPTYQQYALPAGQNYRELLLIFPPTPAEVRIARASGEPVSRQVYESPHWREPNVLAHVRFSDHVDADGRRVLLLEELQSDWHQAGREKGYAGQVPLQENYATWGAREGMSRAEIDATWQTDDPRFRRWQDVQAQAFRVAGAPPPAPFAKTWHEFTMRRMLRWAAERGYDTVAWTTGRQQAERYDLAKHVGQLKWEQARDATTGDLWMARPGAASRGWEMVQPNIAPDRLSDYVGKEIAQRLLLQRPEPKGARVLTGIDLTIGGEGMNAFYDTILPQYVDKYVKKWGSRVGTADIETDTAMATLRSQAERPIDEFPWATVAPWAGRMRPHEMRLVQQFATRQGASNALDQGHGNQLIDLRQRMTAGFQAHAVDVTPAMKRAVLEEGQPLMEPKEPFAPGVPPTTQAAHEAGQRIGSRHGADVSLYLSNAGDLHLEHLAVPKERRGTGAGSAVMRDLTEYADTHGLRMTLDAAQRDPRFGTTGHARLVGFYRAFGFVENKGRHYDPAISSGMYREPRRNVQPSAPGPVSARRVNYPTRPGELDSRQLALFALQDTERGAAAATSLGGTLKAPARGVHAGAGVRTLGVGITVPEELRAGGRVDFRGRAVTSPADLAGMAQVLRDPRYETFRVFYLDKDNRIVGHEAISSRLPGAAVPFVAKETKGGSYARGYEAMRDRMRRLGADAYYLMHNHPSGRTRASDDDINLSARFAREVPGYKGHVIIDSGEYTLLGEPVKEAGGTYVPGTTHMMPRVGEASLVPGPQIGPERLLQPSQPHAILGRAINHGGELTALGQEIKSPRGWIPLIYRASDGVVRAVQEMPETLFQNPAEARNYLRGRRREFGAADVLTHLDDPSVHTLDAAQQLMESGDLTDASIAKAGQRQPSLHEQGARIPTKAAKLAAITKTRATRVGEEGALFQPAPIEETQTRLAEAKRPYLRADLLERLAAIGGRTWEQGAKDFDAWSAKMREDLGEPAEPYLQQVWDEVQRRKAVVEQPDGTIPDLTPTGPTEPPPLTEPRLTIPHEERVVDAARDLFLRAGVPRDEAQLISDQITGMLRMGQLARAGDISPELFRESAKYAGQFLNRLSRLQRELNRLNADDKAVIRDLADLAGGIDEDVAAMGWLRRADNVRRGLLVTQLATSVRNFETQVARVGLDVLDLGLQRALQRTFGKTPTANPAEAYGALLDVWRQIKDPEARARIVAETDKILTPGTPLHDRLLGSYSSDILDRARQADATMADKVLGPAEWAVHHLNILNRFQEYTFRRAVFQATLQDLLAKQGHDLATIIRENRTGEIPEGLLKIAIGKSLELTFAKNPKYGSTAYHLLKAINGLPFLATLPLPFPRFLTNALRFQYEFSPFGFLQLLNTREQAGFRAGDTSVISRATLGTAMLLASYALVESQPDDNRWYQVSAPGGGTLDTRPFNPFASYLFVGYLMKRARQSASGQGPGLLKLDLHDIVTGIASTNFRAGAGLYLIDQFLDQLQKGKPQSILDGLKTFAGGVVAGTLMPLQTLYDLAAQFNERMQIVRDTNAEPFLGPIKARMGLGEPAYRPTREAPLRREQPGLRQLTGITYAGPKNAAEREFDRLQLRGQDILPPTGVPAADNLMAQYMGRLVERKLAPLIEGADYQRLDLPMRELYLHKALAKLRQGALSMLAREHQDLVLEIKKGRIPYWKQVLLEERQHEREAAMPAVPEEAVPMATPKSR